MPGRAPRRFSEHPTVMYSKPTRLVDGRQCANGVGHLVRAVCCMVGGGGGGGGGGKWCLGRRPTRPQQHMQLHCRLMPVPAAHRRSWRRRCRPARLGRMLRGGVQNACVAGHAAPAAQGRSPTHPPPTTPQLSSSKRAGQAVQTRRYLKEVSTCLSNTSAAAWISATRGILSMSCHVCAQVVSRVD